MDKEALRKQLIEEIQGQFESKLRDAKRQKTEAEEELESASERWRAERRRLNSEIDRLESALTEAKDPAARKGAPDAKGAQVDPQEIAKIQKAADEKLKEASTEWETERTRLNTQIARLERSVADAIERSSNPMRSTQPLKEQYEGKLAEAAKYRLELEQQVLRVKAEWDEDKKKTTGEIIKLRRLVPSSKALEAKEKIEKLRGRTETFEEKRIHELENQLTQANADIQKYHQTAVTVRDETRSQYEKRLEDAYRERVKAEEQLTKGIQKFEGERQQLHDQLAQLQQSLVQAKGRVQDQGPEVTELEKTLKEINRSKASLESQLEREREEWNNERRRLNSEISQLENARAEAARASSKTTGPDLADALARTASLERQIRQLEGEKQDLEATRTRREAEIRQELSAKVEEAVRERSLAVEHLQTSTTLWVKEREELVGQMKQLQRSLSDNRETVNNEVVEQLRRQYDQRIQNIIEQKTQLTRELEAASATLQAERSRFAEEVGKSKAAAANAQGSGSAGFDTKVIDAEVKRVEEMLHKITSLIDDPETELSMVIRKNVEKAELDAYLKGILFSVGKGKALA